MLAVVNKIYLHYGTQIINSLLLWKLVYYGRYTVTCEITIVVLISKSIILVCIKVKRINWTNYFVLTSLPSLSYERPASPNSPCSIYTSCGLFSIQWLLINLQLTKLNSKSNLVANFVYVQVYQLQTTMKRGHRTLNCFKHHCSSLKYNKHVLPSSRN